MKERLLCLLIVVFTPLSIRRGAGGEASSLPLGEAGWGFNIRRGAGGEASSLPFGDAGRGRAQPLYTPSSSEISSSVLGFEGAS